MSIPFRSLSPLHILLPTFPSSPSLSSLASLHLISYPKISGELTNSPIYSHISHMISPPLSPISSSSPDVHLSEVKGFKIAHFNVRSLWPKIHSLNLWLTDHNLDVVTLSESWLTRNIMDSLLDFPNYEVIRADRTTGSRGGGLVTLLNKSKGIVCNPSKFANLAVMDRNAEIQVFQLKPRNIKKMIILNCYRPPSGNTDTFLDHLHSILDQIEKLDEFEIYICGDMNIDYNLTNSPGFKKLKHLETKYNLSQIIKSPTRCTATTNSILDLIFTNSSCIAFASPIEVNISDHEPVVAVRKSARFKLPKVNFTCRSYHNYSREAFQRDLTEHDWSDFFDNEDVNQLWDEMEQTILASADTHCPYKSYHECAVLAPWLSQDLLELLKDRDRLY